MITTNLEINHERSILGLSITDDGEILIDISNPDDAWEGCGCFTISRPLEISLIIECLKKLQGEQLKIKENQK